MESKNKLNKQNGNKLIETENKGVVLEGKMAGQAEVSAASGATIPSSGQSAASRLHVLYTAPQCATLCSELCPAVSLIDDYAHAGPSTWNAPSFLLTSVHTLASMQGKGECHLFHKVSLPSFHPQPRTTVPLLNHLLTCALLALPWGGEAGCSWPVPCDI